LSDDGEDILVSVIVSELQFFEIQRESSGRDTVVFDDPFLGPTPEPFQAVDVYPASGEMFSMIDLQMTVATEHQGIIDPIAVSVDDATAAHLGDGQSQHRVGANIRDHLHADLALTLQDAENRNLACSTTAPLALAPTAEVALIQLHLTTQLAAGLLLRMNPDALPDGGERLVHGRIRELQLRGHLAS